MKTPKRKLGIVGTIAALVAGCSSRGFVTPNLGINFPENRWITKFDNAVTYGVRGGVRTKKGVEIEAGYRGHETSYEDAIQRNELEANDLSIGVVYPVWSKGKVSVNAGAGIVSRSEDEELFDNFGNPLYSESRTSTGWRAGVEARFQAGKGELNARVSFEGFGDRSYEKSGVNASVGYTFSF